MLGEKKINNNLWNMLGFFLVEMNMKMLVFLLFSASDGSGIRCENDSPIPISVGFPLQPAGG